MKIKVVKRLMAIVMVAGLLVGCGTKEGTSSNAGESKSGNSDEITLKVALWDYSNTEYFKNLFKSFSDKYPNIKCEAVEFASDEFDTSILTQMSAKTDFDIVFNKDIPTINALISQGHIMELDKFMEKDQTFDKKNYSGLIEQLSIDGKTYGVPFRKDNTLIFYNKDLFDKAGVEYPKDGMTMEEYEELAQKMTGGEGNDKVYGAHTHTWTSNVSQYARRVEEFNPVETSTYKELIPYYKTILNMQDKKITQDYGSLKTSNIHYSGVFYNQQAAMLEIGTWYINMLCENVDFNWGVCALPNDKGEGNDKAVGGVTPVSIGSYSKHPEAAWEFIKYICGEEGAKVLAQNGILPGFSGKAVNDIFDALPESHKGVPNNLSKYIDLDTYIIEFPMSNKAKEIDTVINEEHSAIMTGTETPEDGIQHMIDRVNELD
jgi:extracellular solute-binding family protein 1|nr:sugar ABC transporter substrate-binding protein [uncultured Lachnoanaerobaculum sp.]